ncbi:hypothetical protein [Clostridium porci]|uniref:Uncharacterized protein n=1 Tax=Clostridium porci TaxID=2605778 RepID=A0A7X2TEV6_9CLOT|nr:hypothetical protein [Clostridium porci]MSS38603.1 hypothetical protein [Clostridium porci]
MRIIKKNTHLEFQIKIGSQYVTVASLVPWLFSKHHHKYSLYFYYYGAEFEQGAIAGMITKA